MLDGSETVIINNHAFVCYVMTLIVMNYPDEQAYIRTSYFTVILLSLSFVFWTKKTCPMRPSLKLQKEPGKEGLSTPNTTVKNDLKVFREGPVLSKKEKNL